VNQSEIKILYIGFDGEKVVSSQDTQKQIAEAEKLECGLEWQGRPLNWQYFCDPNGSHSIFPIILQDRKSRVDENTLMVKRPPIAVITARGNQVVRLEYYKGHNKLALALDLRSQGLQGQELPLWLTTDPQDYDPASFLRESFKDKEKANGGN
jgi:hypothetical protein